MGRFSTLASQAASLAYSLDPNRGESGAYGSYTGVLVERVIGWVAASSRHFLGGFHSGLPPPPRALQFRARCPAWKSPLGSWDCQVFFQIPWGCFRYPQLWPKDPKWYLQLWENFLATQSKPSRCCLRQNFLTTWRHCRCWQGVPDPPTPLVGWGSKFDCRLWGQLVWLTQGRLLYFGWVPDPHDQHRHWSGERSWPLQRLRWSGRRSYHFFGSWLDKLPDSNLVVTWSSLGGFL